MCEVARANVTVDGSCRRLSLSCPHLSLARLRRANRSLERRSESVHWIFSVAFITTGILNFHIVHSAEFSISSVMKWATFDRAVGPPVRIPVVGDSWMSYGERSASISESGRTLHHSMCRSPFPHSDADAPMRFHCPEAEAKCDARRVRSPRSNQVLFSSRSGFWTPTVFIRMNFVGVGEPFSSIASHRRRVASVQSFFGSPNMRLEIHDR